MKLLFTGIISIIFISACATNPLTSEVRESLYQTYLKEHKIEQVDKISAFKFRGWREMGKKHLIISSSFNKPYFITLKNTCIDLPYSFAIGINSSSSILSARFDSVFALSFPEQRCFIKTIHKLTRKQAEEMVALEKTYKEESL